MAIFRSVEARREYAERFPYCQACGIDPAAARLERWPGLEVHHMILGARHDRPWNLLVLCNRCHQLCHGASIRVGGVLMPNLSLGIFLAIKRHRDRNNWKPDELANARRSNLPDEEPIPAIIEEEFRARRPRDGFRFYVLPWEDYSDFVVPDDEPSGDEQTDDATKWMIDPGSVGPPDIFA